jgi:peptidoglycan/LPS O-acetylase OafA/YrhL
MTGLKNIRELHVVRGLASLLVLIFHSKWMMWCGGSMYKDQEGLNSVVDYGLFSLDMMTSCGKQCVVTFFILSAFVIAYSFDRNKYDLKTFYTHRSIRIYWPYIYSMFIGLGALYLAFYIHPEIFSHDIREYNSRLTTSFGEQNLTTFLKTLVFVPNQEYFGFNTVYWSLLPEAIFYLLFPFYHKIPKKYLLLGALILMLIYPLKPMRTIYYQSFFLIGMYMYHHFKDSTRGPIFKSKWIYFAVILILLAAINGVLQVFQELLYADIITVGLCFLAFDLLLRHDFKSWRILHKLGDMSYALYLNHMAIFLLLYAAYTLVSEQMVFCTRWTYYLSSAIAVIACYPIYLLTEKPSITFLKKLKQRTK